MNEKCKKECSLKSKLLLLEIGPLKRENRDLREKIQQLKWEGYMTSAKMAGGIFILLCLVIILFRKSFHFSYEKDYRIELGSKNLKKPPISTKRKDIENLIEETRRKWRS